MYYYSPSIEILCIQWPPTQNKAIDRLKNIRHKKYLIPLVKILGADLITGGKSYDSGKETIIIVTHEVSQTGAPILALSLCKNLSKKYNIITILLRGGHLLMISLILPIKSSEPRLD